MSKVKVFKEIGWREYMAIPALGIKEIKVKVDTGARTSALHVSDLKIVKRGRTQFAEFVVHPKQKSNTPKLKARQKIVGHKIVKSSNGESSRRPVIKTNIIIGGVNKIVEITLVNRDMMGFRMLLGRSAIRGDFLVNVSRSYVTRKTRKNGVKK